MQRVMMRRTMLAAAAALTLAGAGPASAQYYGGDDYGPPRRFDRDYDRRDYDRRRDYGDDRFDRRGPPPGRGGNICVTARGTCYTRPGPFNAPCGCDIPGFGYKRGAIGGR